MLPKRTKTIWHKNCHLIVNTHFNIIFMIKLIQETDVFEI